MGGANDETTIFTEVGDATQLLGGSALGTVNTASAAVGEAEGFLDFLADGGGLFDNFLGDEPPKRKSKKSVALMDAPKSPKGKPPPPGGKAPPKAPPGAKAPPGS